MPHPQEVAEVTFSIPLYHFVSTHANGIDRSVSRVPRPERTSSLLVSGSDPRTVLASALFSMRSNLLTDVAASCRRVCFVRDSIGRSILIECEITHGKIFFLMVLLRRLVVLA